MRSRITLAVLVSIVFIGGTIWYKFNPTNQRNLGIVSVSNPADIEGTDSVDTNTEQYDPNSIPVDPTLTKGDQIGRNLITDYVSLATSGQADENSIKGLADQYVETVQNLNTARTVTINDIRSIPNTKANFQKYSEELNLIQNEYATSINKAYPNGAVTGFGPELYTLTTQIGSAYGTAAKKLEEIPTPEALTTLHMQLINLYLSSSNAMLSISNTDKDSSSAFAGIITMGTNMDKETSVVNAINQVLTKNGI